MSPNSTPNVAYCPRYFCALNISKSYQVNFCLPVQPPFLASVSANQLPINQHPTPGIMTHPSPLSVPQQSNTPAAPSVPLQNDTPALPSEPSSRVQSPEPERDCPIHGKSCRSSASSSSSLDLVFTQFSINSAFAAKLTAVEAMHFSQKPFQPPSSPPPRASSPSMESSVTLSTMPTSSPTTESSLTLLASDILPSTVRHWVVFHGRIPGVYTTSTKATGQTDGFPYAFMLAFDDPAAADSAYKRFREDGVLPTHGCGPWVVFMGRRPGVFTSFKELCTSVIGFSNSCYCCCESVEEGYQALAAFFARRVATTSTPTAQGIPGPMDLNLAAFTDDSWWFCFAGAEPGVYNGIDCLTRAAPASRRVCWVNSEDEGWEMWTAYLTSGQVHVVLRA